jgi:hypothetical protein
LTIARELASLTGYRLFHNHLTVDLLTSVFEFGSEPFILLREQIWLSVFHEAAQQDISFIFTFNPESTVRQRFIQDAIDVIETARGELIFIELTCRDEEMEKRIQNPSRSHFGKLASLELFRELKQKGAFEFARLPDTGASFDTSDHTPQETAGLIHQFLTVANSGR